MKKKIVTHYNPDLDAVASVWLIIRWLQGWAKAEFELVPAGKTYQGQRVDSDSNILHVDTGLGMLDHHQTDEYTCAAKKTLEYVRKQREHRDKISLGDKLVSSYSSKNLSSPSSSEKNHREKLAWDEEALERLVEVVSQIDHFQEIYYPEPEADFFEFIVESILDGWKLIYREQDKLVIEKGLDLLDGAYRSLVSKVDAEKIIENKAIEFETVWGKAIAIATANSMVITLAQKRGYKITVRKHPVGGHVKIKAPPANYMTRESKSIDLTPVYERFREIDPKATWYLHASKTMILNGSAKNPGMKATKLSLEEVVDIIESIS